MIIVQSELVAPALNTPPQQDWRFRTIRPFSAYSLHGLVSLDPDLLVVDTYRGYLLKVNPFTDRTQILNSDHLSPFVGATGLSLWEDTLWFTRENQVYFCSLSNFLPECFIDLPYEANGVAVWGTTVYVSCQKAGSIFVYSASSRQLLTKLPLPGIGFANLTVRDEELWICDRTEETVYCMDRATGKVHYSVLTPYENPTGLTFYTHPQTQETILYVTYAGEEAYVRDVPNANPPYELTFRDRTFIHPLHIYYNEQEHYALSNGYLIEVSYLEELDSLEVMALQDVEWRIALPAETHRQKIRHVEPIGIPFTEEIQEGQRVAVFKFDNLNSKQGCILGWKALIEVWGIKYHFTYQDMERLLDLPQPLRDQYLVDDDDLAMDHPLMQQAAQLAVGTETNLLRQALRIRNTVYDRLSYSIKPFIDTPDVAWERGTGSCGEYVGILLALFRLNGIACRTVGRYKCPKNNDARLVPLQPDYNHVWLEFYIPGFGWVPMESNPDDIQEGGPYPTRFFMGLPWYHAEMAKGISFETLRTQGKRLSEISEGLSIGSFALNHVRFSILEELSPTAVST